jgi:hypothetical protein
VFTVEGFGTVVTGTLWRGTVRTGDVLELLPRGAEVRVRRVQVHGETVEEALAGQRTALALHGVERDEVARGDWLCAPGACRPSRVLDVRFELLATTRASGSPTRACGSISGAAGDHRATGAAGRGLAAARRLVARAGASRAAHVAARGDRFVCARIRRAARWRRLGDRARGRAAAALGRGRPRGSRLHESGSLESR